MSKRVQITVKTTNRNFPFDRSVKLWPPAQFEIVTTNERTKNAQQTNKSKLISTEKQNHQHRSIIANKLSKLTIN